MSISDAELRAAIHRVNDVAHDNVPCQPISKLCLPYLRELLAARCLAESLLQLFRNSGPITQCPFCLESGDMLNYDPEYRKPNPDEHSKDCPLLAAQIYLATYGEGPKDGGGE